MKKVLAIVITYNAMDWVDRCLGSLLSSTIPVDTFVIDNGSIDGTQNYIKTHYPSVLFQQNELNLGFGKANNIGLQYAIDKQYDFVYLLNQDAWIFPDTIETLIKISRENSKYGILSPFQMTSDLLHIDKNFIKSIVNSTIEGEIIDALYTNVPKRIYQVQGVMAAHWLLTRDCLLRVGGFSPTFPHYGEDYNYIDRANFFGYKIGVVPSLKVVHDRSERKIVPAKRMYMGYAVSLHELSKLNESKRWWSVISIMVKNTVEYRSIMPIIYLLKTIRSYYTIRRNRKISLKSECAFLNYKCK